MGPFNNREVATAIWLLLLTVWALGKAEIRKSFVAIVRTACQIKIIIPFLLLALYTAVLVALLSVVGLWTAPLLKDTIVWFSVSAVVMMGRFVTARDPGEIFRKVAVDNLKVVILLEFLVNTYTFPLIVELFFVPLLTLVVMVGVYSEYHEEHRAVAKLMKGVQAIAGLGILAFVVVRVIVGLQDLATLDTVRKIVLAPALSILVSPFLYAAVLFSQYEQVFLRINLGKPKDAQLKRHVRWRILRYAGVSVRRLLTLVRYHAADIMHLQTESDVDKLLRDARQSETAWTHETGETEQRNQAVGQ